MPPRTLNLLDLHQNLLVNICRVLTIQDKVQLQLVCKSFLKLLVDPTPGSGIWGAVDLDDFKDDLPPLQLYRHASPRLFPREFLLQTQQRKSIAYFCAFSTGGCYSAQQVFSRCSTCHLVLKASALQPRFRKKIPTSSRSSFVSSPSWQQFYPEGLKSC